MEYRKGWKLVLKFGELNFYYMTNTAEEETNKLFCSASPPLQANDVDDLGTNKDMNREISKPILPNGEHVVTWLPYEAGHNS